MAGNKRGRIKEHLEGVHRNCDWQTYHLQQVLELIEDKSPEITKSIKTLAESVEALDKFNQLIYSKI